MRGRTDYRVTVLDQRLAVRAEGRNSASGLLREVAIDGEDCHELVWSWRVDELQPAADIRLKAKDDVAASIFLLFRRSRHASVAGSGADAALCMDER